MAKASPLPAIPEEAMAEGNGMGPDPPQRNGAPAGRPRWMKNMGETLIGRMQGTFVAELGIRQFYVCKSIENLRSVIRHNLCNRCGTCVGLSGAPLYSATEPANVFRR
jgi:hypothetical protein